MGGGVFNDAGTLTITNSTFTANTARGGSTNADGRGNGLGLGGAVFNYSGTLVLNGVTLSGNSVTSGTTGGGVTGSDGGAIYSLADGQCAAGGNTCNNGPNASLSMFNSVAANNIGTGNSAPNDVVLNAINGASSSVSASGNNAIAAQSPANAVAANITSGFMLGSLTNDVFTPQPGSPLIDAGSCGAGSGLTEDQLGTNRPKGGACDIGAVEVLAPTLSAVNLSDPTTDSTSVTASSILTATSDMAANGSWLVVATGATAPTATQIIAGTDYDSVTVVANGTGAMSAGGATQFSITGLSPGVTYDLYLVATSLSGGTSSIAKVLNWSTPKAIQTITFDSAPTLIVSGGPGTVSATGGGSNNPIIFSTTSSTCSLSDSTDTSVSVSPLAAGDCVVTANQAGNDTYSAAETNSLTITVSPSITVSGTAANGGGAITATLAGTEGCAFASFAFLPTSSVASGPPAGYTLPYGLFEFTTTDDCGGGPVSFTLTYPDAVPTNAQYFKFRPTPSTATSRWYAMPGVVISGNSVTFQITDGQLGDDDVTVNGVIVDAGGLAVPLPSTAIPTLSLKGLALLTLLLGLLGTGWMRRRRA